MRRHRHLRALGAATILVVAALTGGVASPAAAVSASVSTTPSSSWVPWSACSGSGGNCAQVRAITRTADGRIWLGGSFTQLRSPDGSQSVARGNLAVLDTDGTPAPTVAHTFNGTVFTLESDGSSVYAGGGFSKVDGTGALHLARFAAADGARMSFVSGVNGTVYASELFAGRLYVGGKFSAVQGSPRANLAAVDPGTGRVDPGWTPSVTLIAGAPYPNDADHNNVPVRSIAAAPQQNRVYVAGDMDTLNGAPSPTIGAVTPVTGSTAAGFSVPATIDTSFQGMQLAVVDSSSGRDPSVVLAMGGVTNRAVKLRTDGSVAWAVNADGDIQAAAVIDRTVYLGGHFTCVSTVSCYDSSSVGDSARTHVAAFAYGASSNPVADPAWAPALGPTVSPYYYGVWTLYAGGGALHAGGVFDDVVVGGTDRGQAKYVSFPRV